MMQSCEEEMSGKTNAKRVRISACLAVMLLLALPLYGQKRVEASLSARMDSLISTRLPSGSDVGISVYDLTAKKPLYLYNADKLSRPASTLKLLTAIATLARADADVPFRTELWYKGVLDADTLHGDLYVVGGFDPEFTELQLDSLVSAVARYPIVAITGKVYGDVSIKDSLHWGSGWAWDDTPAAYQPYLSALMLNKGVVTVTAVPGERGDTALLECSPASSYYKVHNETRSRTPEAGSFNLSRNWLENGNRLTVKGNVSARRTATVNVYASERLFMHTFVERLRAMGVQCTSEYAFAPLSADSSAVCIATLHTPVEPVVRQLLKESDNLNGEALLHRLGSLHTRKRQVSATDGIAVLHELIKQLGHNPERYKLVDGCGLSNYNYLSPELLVDFLKFAYSRPSLFAVLYDCLPIGGVDGTLKYRMPRGSRAHRNVHAKTGSFTGINALAGYLRAANGHLIAFAVMNRNVLSGSKARAFQDALCEELLK